MKSANCKALCLGQQCSDGDYAAEEARAHCLSVSLNVESGLGFQSHTPPRVGGSALTLDQNICALTLVLVVKFDRLRRTISLIPLCRTMSETVKEDPGIPPDPYRMVYIIFYWLGVGTLLPWNFFISVPGEVL